MKGFFIFLFLLVGSLISFMTYSQEICQWYMAKVVLEEGGPYPNSTFDKMKAEDPDGFKLKFENDLTARIYTAKVADLTNKEDYFMALAQETVTMYVDSSLGKKSSLGDLVYNLGLHLEDGNHFREAYAMFKLFMQTYPDSASFPEAKRESDHLALRYNLS